MTLQEKAAYRAGRLASANDQPRDSNPFYKNIPTWDAWNEGWDWRRPSLLNRITSTVVNIVTKWQYK